MTKQLNECVTCADNNVTKVIVLNSKTLLNGTSGDITFLHTV